MADSFEELQKSSMYETKEVQIEDIYFQEVQLDEGTEQIKQDEEYLTHPISLRDLIRDIKDDKIFRVLRKNGDSSVKFKRSHPQSLFSTLRLDFYEDLFIQTFNKEINYDCQACTITYFIDITRFFLQDQNIKVAPQSASIDLIQKFFEDKLSTMFKI